MQFRSYPNAFGLNINDGSIKLVQFCNPPFCRKDPNYKLSEVRAISLPQECIISGEIRKPEVVRNHIFQLLQGEKEKHKAIKGKWVITSLPDEKSFLKRIILPKKSDEVTQDDILIAAKQHIPFEEAQSYIDWHIEPSDAHAQETSLLIGISDKHTVDMYTYLLESVGLGVAALEIESLAIARAALFSAKKDTEAKAIVDIGSTRSVITIYDNNMVQFSSLLPYSGNSMTKSLVEKLGISHAQAEEIKRTDGLAFSNSRSWPILMHSVESLASQIQKMITFYYSHFPNTNNVQRILLSGGGAATKKIDEVLSQKMHIPVEIVLPQNSFFTQKNDMPNNEKMRYTSAIGLGLRAAQTPFATHRII